MIITWCNVIVKKCNISILLNDSINQIYCETDLSSKDGLTSNIHSFLLSKQYSGFKYHELLIGFNLESTLLFWYQGFSH